MSVIQAQGTIDVPDPVTTYTEPTGPIQLGTFSENQSIQKSIGNFVNTGNVNLVVTVTSQNPVNCTVDNLWFAGSDPATNTVTVIPGQSRQIYVIVTANDFPDDGVDKPLSFELNTAWTDEAGNPV